MNIEIVSGSPRENSVTVRVAKFLNNELSRKFDKHNVDLLDVRDFPLPMVQEVWGSLDKVPEEWKPLAERMFGADAFILVTPEYNGSYSPAMKNLFDHFAKQSRKPFGIVTASPGAMGGMRASQQLQQMVCAFAGVPCPQMLIIPGVDKKFDESGVLTDEFFQKNIDSFVEEYKWLAEKLTD
jgi:NAD(P)H-dependent FMN reductase